MGTPPRGGGHGDRHNCWINEVSLQGADPEFMLKILALSLPPLLPPHPPARAEPPARGPFFFLPPTGLKAVTHALALTSGSPVGLGFRCPGVAREQRAAGWGCVSSTERGWGDDSRPCGVSLEGSQAQGWHGKGPGQAGPGWMSHLGQGLSLWGWQWWGAAPGPGCDRGTPVPICPQG